MPIPTASDAWQSAEQASPLRDFALEFLHEHPNQAFHTRELADEVLDLSWGDRIEERQQRSQRGQNASDSQAQSTEAMYNFVGAQALGVVLRELVDRDEVRVRNVAVDEADLPGTAADKYTDDETIAYYAYTEEI